MGRRLYVGNLPYTTGEAELQELFSKAGTVESVRVMRDAATGRARGSRWRDVRANVMTGAAARAATALSRKRGELGPSASKRQGRGLRPGSIGER